MMIKTWLTRQRFIEITAAVYDLFWQMDEDYADGVFQMFSYLKIRASKNEVAFILAQMRHQFSSEEEFEELFESREGVSKAELKEYQFVIAN